MLFVDPRAAEQVPGLWATGFVLRRQAPPEQTQGVPDASRIVPGGVDLANLKEHPTAAAYRRLSWQVGIDPTKNRPAGEALARRILQGKSLPRIHPLVDAYNLASAHTLVPLGAYDARHFDAPITVRPARNGERFHGIGRDPEALEPGRIVYTDATDRICGVFLWRDAHETRVRDDSTRVLVGAVGGDPLPIQTGLQALGVVAEFAGRIGWRSESPPPA